MATRQRTTENDKNEKTVALPPKDPRNADPIADAPGSHPIETGIGAALGGAASGLAIGALGGPVGAVIGAVVGGAVAGGLAGKGVGELIDPTTEDSWLSEYFGSRTARREGETADHHRLAFQYGLRSAERHIDRRFDDVEPDLRSGWEKARGTSTMSWDDASGAVQHAFERGTQIPLTSSTVTATIRNGNVKA